MTTCYHEAKMALFKVQVFIMKQGSVLVNKVRIRGSGKLTLPQKLINKIFFDTSDLCKTWLRNKDISTVMTGCSNSDKEI